MFTSGGKTTGVWSSTLGNTGGCWKFDSVGRNNSDLSYIELQTTWEDLGVPSGATINQIITSSIDWRCDVANVSDSYTIGALEILDNTLISQATLFSGQSGSGVTSYASKTGTSNVAIPSAIQASSTTIYLRFNTSLVNGNDKNAETDLLIDNLSFTIDYSTASLDATVNETSLETLNSILSPSITTQISTTIATTILGSTLAIANPLIHIESNFSTSIIENAYSINEATVSIDSSYDATTLDVSNLFIESTIQADSNCSAISIQSDFNLLEPIVDFATNTTTEVVVLDGIHNIINPTLQTDSNSTVSLIDVTSTLIEPIITTANIIDVSAIVVSNNYQIVQPIISTQISVDSDILLIDYNTTIIEPTITTALVNNITVNVSVINRDYTINDNAVIGNSNTSPSILNNELSLYNVNVSGNTNIWSVLVNNSYTINEPSISITLTDKTFSEIISSNSFITSTKTDFSSVNIKQNKDSFSTHTFYSGSTITVLKENTNDITRILTIKSILK